MTVEHAQKRNHTKARTASFYAKVALLPPAPVGMEYKRFHGQPILFPATADDPIREGTGYTQKQLDTALSLQRRMMREPDLLKGLAGRLNGE